jgi:multiple sugar transport system substrate-binding protein
MVATGQRFCETHPGAEITWVKRSLEEFGHYPLAKLAENFDLMVIDHPFSSVTPYRRWTGLPCVHDTIVTSDFRKPPDRWSMNSSRAAAELRQ